MVEPASSIEGGDTPHGQRATAENIEPYLMEEQRRAWGWIASRMPGQVSPRLARPAPPFADPTRDASTLGRLATAAVGIGLLAWSLTLDLPHAMQGFFGDAATYYSLGHSLAQDGDFAFTRDDLVRVWREFETGPEGIFLKRGRDVQRISLSASPPFFAIASAPDSDDSRLFYGKGFIYPLVAAPLVWLFGTNGFLVLHALLMTACFACAYAFVVTRSPPALALVYAATFLFLSVAPVYMVWLTPDFFNLALVLIAYFLWCYKEALAERADITLGARASRWLLSYRSDLLAAALLGVVFFSKPTNLLLIGPLLALHLWRGQWGRLVGTAAAFILFGAGLFAMNVAITGEWNYQGGETRGTFYAGDPDGGGPRIGGFPFQTAQHTIDTTGHVRETNRVPIEVLTGGDALFEVFRRNLLYFFFGRHTGFVPYFFPGAVAILLFLFATRQRAMWQWLTLGAGLGSALFLMLYMPFTYSGGGGPVGNRYFLGVYPVFLFVLPPLARFAPIAVAVLGGALFTAQLVVNPLTVSQRPAEHVKSGPYRLLPVEMTLLSDLPMNVTPHKVKQALGGDPPVNAYFLDDNAFRRESDGWFWVRGESRAELLLRAPIFADPATPDQPARALRIVGLEVQLEGGPEPNRVSLDGGGEVQVLEMPASDRRTVRIGVGDGLPYRPDPALPMNYVYKLSIESQRGFVPLFWTGGRDARFLGVFVRIVPLYDR